MTQTTDDDQKVLYFEERAGTWYLQKEAVRYGAPEKLKEKKASHTRNLRPLEVELFGRLYGNAKQWEKFRAKCLTLDEEQRRHDADASVFERVAAIARRTRAPRAAVLVALGYEPDGEDA